MEHASRYPVFAIVGRPNVGKSSLLNALARRRVAIVEPTPGVTRDRVSVIASHRGLSAEVIDTAGLGVGGAEELEAEVSRQIDVALDVADAVILVMDAREGVVSLDLEAVDAVRRTSKPVILVANKVDSERERRSLGDFYEVGFGEPVATAAIQSVGRRELFERMIETLGEENFVRETDQPEAARIAVVGRRNAGKSTLVNRLVGRNRVVVSETPGTTRDAVDVPFEADGRSFVLVDTAGVRKRGKLADSVEFYSMTRTREAMRRADVIILVLDSLREISKIDKQIGRYAADHYKPCIVALNKWDLADDERREAFKEYVAAKLPGLAGSPMAFLSSLTGEGVERLLAMAAGLKAESATRVTTGELNRVLRQATALRRPKPAHGAVGKIYYGTQVGVQPPAIVLFVNRKRLFQASYLRFIENHLREHTPLARVPIRLELREKGELSSEAQAS